MLSLEPNGHRQEHLSADLCDHPKINEVDRWITPRKQKRTHARVGVDDLIDAAIALLTASRMSEGRASVLGDGAIDARGLRMEIVA